MNIPIIYEDDWLCIVDKPAGLLTVPTPKKEQRTLTGILNDDLKTKGKAYRLHPCHRLDREASGLIIYAKGKSIQRKMMELFRAKKVSKGYIAFVHGSLGKETGQIQAPIDGLPAQTGYRVILRKKDFDVAQVTTSTGRTNQIRIHFKSIGHPLVGETKFAFRKDFKLKAKRASLHAKSLEFIHPVSGRHLKAESALAPDMQKFLELHPD